LRADEWLRNLYLIFTIQSPRGVECHELNSAVICR
jgi:hypothetical protein